MSKTFKYVLVGLGILFFAFMLWFFSSIVTYIIIASILTVIGVPVVEFLGRFHIGKLRIPVSIRALLTLILIWIVFIGFFRIFIPVVAREASELSSVNVDALISKIQGPLDDIETIFDHSLTWHPGLRERLYESRVDCPYLPAAPLREKTNRPVSTVCLYRLP